MQAKYLADLQVHVLFPWFMMPTYYSTIMASSVRKNTLVAIKGRSAACSESLKQELHPLKTITLHACARGKAISFVRLSAQGLPDLDI